MLVVWLLAVALAGSLVTLWVPRQGAKVAAGIIGALLIILYIGLLLHPGQGVNVPWIPAWGIRFHLGSDGLSLFLLGLTVVMTEVAILASKPEWGRMYYFWILFLEFGSLGLFSALDLFLFYIFWEIVLIPIFFLLTSWSGVKGRRAAMKWLI
ncbi:MAG: proton-conducting transporter transmembrane domain-containing protein, partial [Sulfobacillus sp.]